MHYPGTYAHGGYNRETTIMGGRPVLNEDLVNLPNWLVLKLLIEGEEAIGFDNVELLSYRHELDVRNAVVMRELRFRVGEPALAARFEVRSIPTLVVISDGEVIGAYPGVVGADQLVGALDQLAPTPEPETVLQEGAAR